MLLAYQMGIQIYDQISIPRNCSQVKLRCTVLLALTLSEVKIALQKLVCTVVYQIGNQIYHQVLVWRSCSKVNLHHATFLGFGLKEVKIALNMLKVFMHACLPNGNLNLWLNFNSEKLVKIETRQCSSTKVGLKGGENSFLSREIWCPGLSIKWDSKSIIQFQLWEIAQNWILSYFDPL